MGKNELKAEINVLAVSMETANCESKETSSSKRSGDVMVVITKKIINSSALEIIVVLQLLFYINTLRRKPTATNSTRFLLDQKW